MNSSKLALALLGLGKNLKSFQGSRNGCGFTEIWFLYLSACLIQVGYSLRCYTCTSGCKSASEVNQTDCTNGQVCQTQIYVVMGGTTWAASCMDASSATNSTGGTSIYGLGYTTKSYSCNTDLCNPYSSNALTSKSNVFVLLASTLSVLLMLSL